MTKDELIRSLKEDLGIKKEIIALKAVNEPSADIPQYEGQAIPGMCALLGELLREKQAWYITRENLGCFMSLLGTGTCEQMPQDQFIEFMQQQNEAYRIHKDADTVASYYAKVDSFFKYPEKTGNRISYWPAC